MGLIDLKTDLTSLKYGKDVLGGGNSQQSQFLNTLYNPAIPSTINPMGQDNLIRGGAMVGSRVENDLKRFKNFITSPAGVFFIAKQEILARQQAKLPRKIKPTRIYSPLQTAAQVAGNPFGLHVLGKGLGVIDDVSSFVSNPLQYLTAAPSIDPTNRYLYLTQKRFNDNDGELTNRLSILYNYKILDPSAKGKSKKEGTFAGRALRTVGGLFSQSPAKGFGIPLGKNRRDVLISFSGGPNAVIPGISNSRYLKVTNTQQWDEIGPGGKGEASMQSFAVLSIDQLNSSNAFKNSPITVNDLVDFRKTIIDGENIIKNSKAEKILSSTDYAVWNRQSTYGMGNPGQRGLDRRNFMKSAPLAGSLNTFPGRDEVTWSQLYMQGEVKNELADKDIIPFYITAISNDNPKNNVYIHFRAFIDSFSDNYNPTWNSYKFMGRGENFFTYGGFNRTISLAFKVHAQTKGELKIMYTKLNYLASLCAPDYSLDNGFMRGNLIKLTVGDYLSETPGILTGLSFNIDDATNWDLGRDLEGNKVDMALPHLINVGSFGFTPIQSFIPQKVSDDYVEWQSTENLTPNFISMGKNKEGYGLVPNIGLDKSAAAGTNSPPVNEEINETLGLDKTKITKDQEINLSGAQSVWDL